MPNDKPTVTISKSKLAKTVISLKDDLGFQTLLLRDILNNLPTAYTEMLVRDEYFKRCHKGEYYVLTHGSHMELKFATSQEVEHYLWGALPATSIRKVRLFVNGGIDELYGWSLQKQRGE